MREKKTKIDDGIKIRDFQIIKKVKVVQSNFFFLFKKKALTHILLFVLYIKEMLTQK